VRVIVAEAPDRELVFLHGGQVEVHLAGVLAGVLGLELAGLELDEDEPAERR
jgi:hypothetical protein